MDAYERLQEEVSEYMDTDIDSFIRNELMTINYTDLQRISRTIREEYDDIDFEAQSVEKEKLAGYIADAGVFVSATVDENDYYIRRDGEVEPLELLPPATEEGKEVTVLYGFIRSAATADDLRALKDVLEEAGYDIVPSDGNEENVMIRREKNGGAGKADPHAVLSGEIDMEEVYGGTGQDDAEEPDEASDEEAEDEDEEDEVEEEEAEEDEDESEESEADDDDEDAQISYDLAQERLDEKTDDQVYTIAQDEEIDGRSNMDKQERIDAILEKRVEDGVVAPPEE